MRRTYCSYGCLRSALRGLPYRLTPRQLDDLFKDQAGRCALCDRRFDGVSMRPNVDHDHLTGMVRGLLCHRCNLRLGHFEQRLRSAPERLARYADFGTRALAYLARARARGVGSGLAEMAGTYGVAAASSSSPFITNVTASAPVEMTPSSSHADVKPQVWMA